MSEAKRLQEAYLNEFGEQIEVEIDDEAYLGGEVNDLRKINREVAKHNRVKKAQSNLKDTDLAGIANKSNILEEFVSDESEEGEESEEESEGESEEESEEDVEYEEYAVEEQEKTDTRVKIREEDNNLISEANQVFNKEDESYLREVTAVTDDEVKKGKNIENQRKLFSSLIGLRIVFEDSRKIYAKFAQNEQFELIVRKDKYLEEKRQALASTLLSITRKMVTLLASVLFKSNISDNLSGLLDSVESAGDSASLFEALDKIGQEIDGVVREIINIWYRKTQVASFKASTKLVKQMNNDYCAHVAEATEKNFKSILRSTQRKGDKFRVIGKEVSSLAAEEDRELYNDSDLYSELLSEFLNESKQTEQEDPTAFLQRKRASVKKDVDRKASKNRRLRYDVHEKLVNFMLPQELPCLVPGREEIVRALFRLEKPQSETAADIEII